MAAIGNATRHGFLIREGDALERLSQIKTITFDKTGTLTHGTPSVVHVEGDVYALCAAVEQHSEHPIGRAILRCYQLANKTAVMNCENFVMLPGRGVSATVDGVAVLAGSSDLLLSNGIYVSSGHEWMQRARTVT